MKRAWTLLPIFALAGCGGTNSNLNQPAGPYTGTARDARERQELVTKASKELGQGANVKAIAAINGFGIALLKGTKGPTRMVSPLSITTAMAMAANGAQGETQKSILTGLQMGKLSMNQVNEANRSIRTLLGNADPAMTLNIANALWPNNRTSIKTEFLKQNEANFGAKTASLDYASPTAPKTINDWVREATGGKIPELVDKLDPNSRLVLTNAVYLKAAWSKPFEPLATQEGDFKPAAEKTARVMFMSDTRITGYAAMDGYQMVSLPYGAGNFELILVLPKSDLDAFLKDLDGARWDKLTKSLTPQRVALKLPKFTGEFSVTLNDYFKTSGMTLPFEPGKANFRDIADEDLFISSVVHKTFIDVTETGTEAAAATKVEIAATSAPVVDPAIKVTFDRPFVYAIRERATGLLLFVGTYSGPATAKPL